MKVRIGIDVGGTFTDGVAVCNETFEVLKKVKVPTTHGSEYGVAQGIVDVLTKIMEELHLGPDDIVFLAHGTTQATNALLEGDVKEVGILATASGIEVGRARVDSNIEEIPLTAHKSIRTHHEFIENSKLGDEIDAAIARLKEKGAKVIVAAEPYSVDNPNNELFIQDCAQKQDIPATSTHEISSLYGLKLRTRTAVINASILPKMIETSNMTEESVKRANIKSQLMIMRCDGGVMSVDEVRSRPIMTLLSGPAAGVAGALMYEKISDGLFLEVGGTSTDISAIKNGEVMLKYAEVGGHKTYVNSLDVRTLGIAGGSMIRLENNKIADVGPRSAHIAGFDYEAFAQLEDLVDPEIAEYHEEHESYIYLQCSNGKKFSLTLTGAANVLGLVPQDGYSKGNVESSIKAYEVLGKKLGCSAKEAAQQVMDLSVAKVTACLNQLIADYDLDPKIIEIVGGGGGSGSIVPHCGLAMNLPYRLAKNAEVISTIGVALAMVREVVERSMLNPTESDILKIRKEAEEKVIRSGADPKTIEIKIEIDKNNNMLRAIATGSSELKQKDFHQVILEEEELKAIAKKSMNIDSDVRVVAQTDALSVLQAEEVSSSFFGLSKKVKKHLRVMTKEGVIKLKLTNMNATYINVETLYKTLESELTKHTKYTDGGEEVPIVYVGIGARLLDFSGLISREQILSMLEIETKFEEESKEAFILLGKR